MRKPAMGFLPRKYKIRLGQTEQHPAMFLSKTTNNAVLRSSLRLPSSTTLAVLMAKPLNRAAKGK